MQYDGSRKIPWRIRLSELESERTVFDSHWREIDQYMAPGRFRDGHNAEENRGEKKHGRIINETALRARRTFTAGFVSGMTNPARPWFKLSLDDRSLQDFAPVRAWLEEVERRVNLVLQKSNFYQAIPNVYDDMGTFGTGALTVKENPATGAWFQHHPVGDYYVATNPDGIVDTMYRETLMTADQMVTRFGIDNVSTAVSSSYNAGDTEHRYYVTQAIEPNTKRLKMRAGFDDKAFRSVWFEESGPEDSFLGMRGFDEFPAMCVRWQATSLDDYGIDCPGMTALGGVKQLQTMERRKGQAIDKMVNPHLQVPPNLKGIRSFLPGGTTVYDQTTPNGGIRPIHDVNLRLDYLVQDMGFVQRRIEESFFVDLFLMISQMDETRTATEIALRNEEKLVVLGPALQRVQTELLDPLIDRVYSILERQNALPLPPPELEGQPITVKYISMLAQAQQQVATSSIERFMGAAANAAQLKPDALDKVNIDGALEEYAETLGVPSKLIYSDQQVAEMRKQRQEFQQQAASLEAAQQAANTAKTASEVDLQGGNFLAQLIGAQPGG